MKNFFHHFWTNRPPNRKNRKNNVRMKMKLENSEVDSRKFQQNPLFFFPLVMSLPTSSTVGDGRGYPNSALSEYRYPDCPCPDARTRSATFCVQTPGHSRTFIVQTPGHSRTFSIQTPGHYAASYCAQTPGHSRTFSVQTPGHYAASYCVPRRPDTTRYLLCPDARKSSNRQCRDAWTLSNRQCPDAWTRCYRQWPDARTLTVLSRPAEHTPLYLLNQTPGPPIFSPIHIVATAGFEPAPSCLGDKCLSR